MLRGASLDAIGVLCLCINICDDWDTSAMVVKLALDDPLQVLHSEMYFHDRNIIETWSTHNTPSTFKHMITLTHTTATQISCRNRDWTGVSNRLVQVCKWAMMTNGVPLSTLVEKSVKRTPRDRSRFKC